MSKIKLSINANNKVQIDPVENIQEELWQNIINWWSLGSEFSKSSKFLEVDPSQFSLRRDWLRENWTSLGHKLIIDDTVKDYLKTNDKLEKKFISLADAADTIKDVNLNQTHFKEIDLTKFQKDNIAALIAMPNGANFSVPGAGKTLTTLAVWRYLKIPRLLVICPRSAFEAWEADSKFLSDQPVINQFTSASIPTKTNILYTNYEQLENPERLSRLKKWAEQKEAMLVIDEAHRIKGGSKSIRWRACANLSDISVRTDILTGTPMPQSQDDLRNLFSLSWKGIAPSFFTENRLSTLKRGGVFVRTTKKELELPPMSIELIRLPMSDIQQAIYLALKRSFVSEFSASLKDQDYFSRRGKAVMTLMAAATNPGLLMKLENEDAYLGLNWPPKKLQGSERLLGILENYSSHEIPIKYEWIIKYISKASKEGRKVLIWSTFIGNLVALEKLLAPFGPMLIYGATSQEERKQKLNFFRYSKESSVLLTNPQTLGEGMSLHLECHETIYLDRSYNAGLYLQSLDRIHRLGLPKGQITKAFILQSEGTIDFRIARRLEMKIKKLAQYMDDAGLLKISLPDEDNQYITQEMLGTDNVDLNDLYEHLKND